MSEIISKKKIAYFNCTGVFPHIGCLAVTDSHLRELLGAGYELAHIYTSLETKFLRSKERKQSFNAALQSEIKTHIENVDAVVINAEGSIHHIKTGQDLLAIAELAQHIGTPVFVVNAVMQDVEGYDDVLEKCNDITVREQKSFEYLQSKNIACRLVLDSILDAQFVNTATHSYAGRYAVTDWQAQRDADVGKTVLAYIEHQSDKDFLVVPFLHSSYMVNHEWSHAVANFKDLKLLITGRHHAVYVAGLAGAPFVALPSNTHKIEGTIACSELPIPLCDNYLDLENAVKFAHENPTLYKEFQDFLISHKGLETFTVLKDKLGVRPTKNIEAEYECIMKDLHKKAIAFEFKNTIPLSKTRIRNKNIAQQKNVQAREIQTLKKLIDKITYEENIIDNAGPKGIIREVNVLIKDGKIDTAKEKLETRLREAPEDREALYTLSRVEIHGGNTARGLSLMHHRSHILGYYPKTSFHAGTPVWDGTPTKDKVLVWSSLGPGIGTEVFMFSLLEKVFEVQKNILVACDPRLLPTMRRTFPRGKFCGYNDIGENGRNLIKYQCSLWSLPDLHFKFTETDTLPKVQSYLKIDEEKCDAFRTKYKALKNHDAPLIGISWHTPNQKTVGERALNDEHVLKLTALENTQFISLQHAAEDLPLYNHPSMVFDETINPITDLDGLIHQIATMDIVITIDNSVAYIAGALGIPAYVLVPHVNIWTWEVLRAFPDFMSTLTPIQQDILGDWSNAVSEVIEKLQTTSFKKAI